MTRSVVARATLSIEKIEVTIGVKQLGRALGLSINLRGEEDPTIVSSIAAELRRAGQSKRLVIGEPYKDMSDASLVEFLKGAFVVRQKLLADTSETLNEITAHSTKSKGRLTALMRGSYQARVVHHDREMDEEHHRRARVVPAEFSI